MSQELLSRIEQLELRVKELEALVGKDEMTGLLRRCAGETKLENLTEACAGRRKFYSFALIDIDHFKKVNDTYGHPVGDVVIKALANCIRLHVRSEDIAFRLGGEEFGIAFEDTTGLEAACILERIQDSFKTIEFEAEGHCFQKTISVGLTTCALKDTYHEVYEAADRALYHSKNNGRDRLTMF